MAFKALGLNFVELDILTLFRLYCPPEWFTFAVYLSQEATIWSLGVVLYSMLNGQLPYLNEKDICTKHLLGPLPKFFEYSVEADDLIQCCLAYEPFKRMKLDKLKKHKWLATKLTSTWQSMLNDLLQQSKGLTNSVSSRDESRKESGVNTSTQMSAQQNNQRQNASLDQPGLEFFRNSDQLFLETRQHETMAVHVDKPLSMQHHANTCVLETEIKKRRERAEKQFKRSKTSR